MDVIEIKNQMLLAGSTPGLGGEYNGETVLTPELLYETEF